MEVTLTEPCMYRGTRFLAGDSPNVDAKCAERWERKGWTKKPKRKAADEAKAAAKAKAEADAMKAKTEAEAKAKAADEAKAAALKDDSDSGKSLKLEGTEKSDAKPAKKPTR